MSARRSTVLVGSGAVLTACAGFWAQAGDLTVRVGAHLGVYAVAFFAYLCALAASRGLAGRRLAVALGLAVAWRVAVLPGPPPLSTDVYRYIWEGRVQGYGGNPYAWEDRASAEKWAPVRDELWQRTQLRGYTAVYPPGWQLAARAVTALSPTVLAMKAFVVACELAAWAVLWRILRRRRLPESRLLVAAWSPLALVEVSGSGHNDPFAVLFLCLAVLALDGERRGWSAAAAALGAAAKLLPGIVAIAWGRRYRVRDVALAAAVGAVTALPYASAGAGLWRGTGDYGSWRFNESALALVDAVAPSPLAAQRLATFLLLALALVLAARRTELARAGLAVVAGWLALAAQVHPWYALWLLPWLTLVDAPAALLFTGTVQLAYMVFPGYQSGAGWQVPWSVRALEYLPCVGLAAWIRLRSGPIASAR